MGGGGEGLKKKKEREGARENMCVCVCACVRVYMYYCITFTDHWSLLHSAILRSQAASPCSCHVWFWMSDCISFIASTFDICQSGVLTALSDCCMAGATWNCCRLGASSWDEELQSLGTDPEVSQSPVWTVWQCWHAAVEPFFHSTILFEIFILWLIDPLHTLSFYCLSSVFSGGGGEEGGDQSVSELSPRFKTASTFPSLELLTSNTKAFQLL